MRFWEIDLLRGTAVIMMVTYHLLYDLAYFGGYPLKVEEGFWLYFARATASIFIFLAGFALVLDTLKFKAPGARFKRCLQRGLKIFAWGLGVTAVTWYFIGEGFVVYGILHFIGTSIILGFPFLGFRLFNLPLGIAFLLIGRFLERLTIDSPWLLWVGLAPAGFYSLDYFPLFPWFGLVLLGMAAGSYFSAPLKEKQKGGPPPFLGLPCFLGRHALFVYLAHQPLLVSLLFLAGLIPLPQH